MLSCQKCGAPMRGVDMVCKQCGTPWGKTGKSHKPIYLTSLLVVVITVSVLAFANPELINTSINFFRGKFNSENNIETPEENISSENIPTETTPPQEEIPPPDNTIVPEVVTPEPEILPPVFTSVTASSSLSAQGNFSYTPNLTTDNDNKTAWLEGAKGNGINEWIMFSADTPQYVKTIHLFNGYQKNSKTYINNNRLKKVQIDFSDGTSFIKTLPTQNYQESLDGVKMDFTDTHATTYVKITILDVEKGAYYSDTAINEIKFY